MSLFKNSWWHNLINIKALGSLHADAINVTMQWHSPFPFVSGWVTEENLDRDRRPPLSAGRCRPMSMGLLSISLTSISDCLCLDVLISFVSTMRLILMSLRSLCCFFFLFIKPYTWSTFSLSVGWPFAAAVNFFYIAGSSSRQTFSRSQLAVKRCLQACATRLPLATHASCCVAGCIQAPKCWTKKCCSVWMCFEWTISLDRILHRMFIVCWLQTDCFLVETSMVLN